MLNKFSLLLAAIMMLSLVSCSDEDDTTGPSDPNNSFEVNSQMISQNTVIVSEATFEEDGWIVIHADNGNDGPIVPNIVSEPVYVTAGISNNISVPLTSGVNLNGETILWVMLHTDDGTSGEYEFDGENGIDAPLTDADGNVLIKSITVSNPSIEVENQSLQTNTLTIGNVNAAVDGWLVIHNQNSSGNIEIPEIIGKTAVTAGENTNVQVVLDATITIEVGHNLYPMLHIDDGTIGEYEFDGQNGLDAPEVYGYDTEGNPNVIVTEITVQ